MDEKTDKKNEERKPKNVTPVYGMLRNRHCEGHIKKGEEGIHDGESLS